MGTNENKITESIKKSTLGANGRFDYEKLVYDMPYFLPCVYQEELEEVFFTYDLGGMKSAHELQSEEKENQYQFLINFSKLESLLQTYHISLSPENIYYDDNYIPHVKHRDLYVQGTSYSKQEFLFLYKTFVGGILGRKYNIQSLQESGLEQLKQEKLFAEFYEAEDCEEIERVLRRRKEAYIKRQKETMIRVPKGTHTIKTVLSIAAPILLFLSILYLGYLLIALIPFQNKVTEAHKGFIASDYVACIDSVKDIDPVDMDISTKYILAVSYAKSESLRKEELEGIISKLSLSSNEKELEYWIYLGRLESEKAENLAKALSDDKLLIYAYMKELSRLETDTAIEGEEKAARISQLEQNISSLGEKYSGMEIETE